MYIYIYILERERDGLLFLVVIPRMNGWINAASVVDRPVRKIGFSLLI